MVNPTEAAYMIVKLKRMNPMKHILSEHVLGLLMVRTASSKSRAPALPPVANCRAVQRGRKLRKLQGRALQKYRASRVQTEAGTQAIAGIHALPFRKTRSALPQIVCCVRRQSKLALPAL
jgi:hypothetical protein